MFYESRTFSSCGELGSLAQLGKCVLRLYIRGSCLKDKAFITPEKSTSERCTQHIHVQQPGLRWKTSEVQSSESSFLWYSIVVLVQNRSSFVLYKHKSSLCCFSSHSDRIIQFLFCVFSRPPDPDRTSGLWSFARVLPLCRGQSRQVSPQRHHHGDHQCDWCQWQHASVWTRGLQHRGIRGSDAWRTGDAGKN